MEKVFLREALFAGMTANGFRLGTVLSLGWFWMRPAGCSVLYRSENMESIDFGNALSVAAIDAGQISPPSYLPHDSGSIYFYVLRRVNGNGAQEHTLSAVVRLVIDEQGNLARPQPNRILAIMAEQTGGNRVSLVWYYCPLGQASKAVRFNVYGDGGTGQIDFENPLVVVEYAGRKFYRYESDPLDAGKYLFSVRVADAAGVEGGAVIVQMQLLAEKPQATEIMNAEAI